ncbi:MAG TPA: hypothetical protein DEG69_11205, partial [Flavobacteriaceae bacterium]|nr:hypothetical protein [Flavobacteriaceae bacterium]
LLLKTKSLPLLLILFFISTAVFSQQAVVKGVLLNEEDQPVVGASISYGTEGTLSDFNGYYLIEIPANEEVTLT